MENQEGEKKEMSYSSAIGISLIIIPLAIVTLCLVLDPPGPTSIIAKTMIMVQIVLALVVGCSLLMTGLIDWHDKAFAEKMRRKLMEEERKKDDGK